MNRKYPVDIRAIDNTYDFYKEVGEMYKQAENYLLNFRWCKEVNNAQLYLNMGEVLCVFLFEIENNQSEEDNLIWVVVGDMPPIYLDIYGARSVKEVLLNYIELANEWIENVLQGRSLDQCFPFSKKPSKQLAKMLQSRIDFIENSILENIEDIHLQTKES